jgi:hypothetical protein
VRALFRALTHSLRRQYQVAGAVLAVRDVGSVKLASWENPGEEEQVTSSGRSQAATDAENVSFPGVSS